MSGLPPWTKEDFADSFQRAMPTGPVWPRDPDTTQRRAIEALMPTYVRSWQTARQIPVEGLPTTTDTLLSEWEASVGLPDPCSGPDATLDARRAHVVTRLTQTLGASVPEITAYAAGLGYAITIAEFGDLAFESEFDLPFADAAWLSAWQINVPGTGPALVLECEMRRLNPADAVLLFSYEG